jgi:hypothetical protein
VANSEKLSWDEIKEKYCDEWVILVEPEVDRSTTTLLGGRVFAHGKDRDRIHNKLKDVQEDFSIRWTGQLRAVGILPLRLARKPSTR